MRKEIVVLGHLSVYVVRLGESKKNPSYHLDPVIMWGILDGQAGRL
jgi:hypothetical protein